VPRSGGFRDFIGRVALGNSATAPPDSINGFCTALLKQAGGAVAKHSTRRTISVKKCISILSRMDRGADDIPAPSMLVT
jgi:hypothetical protein